MLKYLRLAVIGFAVFLIGPSTAAFVSFCCNGAGASGLTTFQVLKLGGSGFITGVDLHADGTKVLRADSGGGYIWNGSTWSPIVTVNSMPTADASVGSLLGVYELRIAPSNSSRFYMLYNGYVFRTDNKGATWTRTAFTQVTTSDANDGNYRGMGPKMAIDPQNADVVVVGTQTNGLWYTANAGASWTLISSATASTTGGFLVRYDPSSAVSGGLTQGIYASSYGQGVFHTTTGPGGTWSLTPSSPTTHQGLAIASDGVVFLTGNDADTNIHKFASGAWSTISTGSAPSIQGVAVDPADAAHIVVVNAQGDVSVSADHGATWTGYSGSHALTSTDVPWLTYTNGGSASAAMYPGGGSIAFDPSGSNLLYLGYGLGVATGNPPNTAATMAWTDITAGIEELIGNRIIKPPGGDPIMAGWDQGVFQSTGPNVYPSTKGTTNNSGGLSAGWDVDYCAGTPATIVALIEWPGNPTSGKSTNGGAAWNQFVGSGYQVGGNRGGMIACNGGDATNYVLVRSDNGATADQPFYTLDGGSTWNAITISGVNTSGTTGWNDNYYWRRHILTADRVTPDTFYMYNYGPSGSAPGVYKSSNKGAGWSLASPGAFPAGGTIINARLVSVPGQAGHLFYTNGQYGVASMQRSTNGGLNWSVVSTAGEVWAIGFGKAKPGGGGYPAIFIVGYVGGVFGIYRSDDNAATWVSLVAGPNVANPNGSLDTITDITGDPDVYGDVYIALSETGFMYGKYN